MPRRARVFPPIQEDGRTVLTRYNQQIADIPVGTQENRQGRRGTHLKAHFPFVLSCAQDQIVSSRQEIRKLQRGGADRAHLLAVHRSLHGAIAQHYLALLWAIGNHDHLEVFRFGRPLNDWHRIVRARNRNLRLRGTITNLQRMLSIGKVVQAELPSLQCAHFVPIERNLRVFQVRVNP